MQSPTKPYRFVFGVRFKTEKDLENYVKFWTESSRLIQEEPGAQGTRLHRVEGELTVFAVAQWESKEARDRAFENLERKYASEHPLNRDDGEFGEVFIIGGGSEIDAVFPSVL